MTRRTNIINYDRFIGTEQVEILELECHPQLLNSPKNPDEMLYFGTPDSRCWADGDFGWVEIAG